MPRPTPRRATNREIPKSERSPVPEFSDLFCRRRLWHLTGECFLLFTFFPSVSVAVGGSRTPDSKYGCGSPDSPTGDRLSLRLIQLVDTELERLVDPFVGRLDPARIPERRGNSIVDFMLDHACSTVRRLQPITADCVPFGWVIRYSTSAPSRISPRIGTSSGFQAA